MAERAALPDWPALMRGELARAYLSMGEPLFRTVTARHKVRPVDLGASGLWYRRRDLDELIERLPAKAAAGEADAPAIAEADPLEAGMKAAQRRGRRKRS